MLMRIILVLCLLNITFALKSQVTISGVVKNYNDSVFYISETGGFYNFTRLWRDKRVKVTIDKNGHFKAIIPEQAIDIWYITTEKGNQFFHFIKGEDLELVADFSRAQPLYATGKNADDFNYTMYEKEDLDNYYAREKFWVKVKTNIDSALLYRKALAVFKGSVLEKYRAAHKMSDLYYNWLRSRYAYEPFERTLVVNIQDRNSVSEAVIAQIMEKGISDEYAALNTSEYNDLVDFFIDARIKQEKKGTLTLSDRFNFVADNNILTGSTRDVYLSRFMALMIKTPDSIYSPLFKKYDGLVQNEKMKQEVAIRRSDYTDPATTSPAAADYSRARSVMEILKKYKGKVIYIDFWASWCVPCRAEMPNATALKEKLKGKDIVFLYLGYNDKEKAWLKARSQMAIEGEHYLLDDKMKQQADELFGINGIPHYAILDREGRIVSKRAERPGDVYTLLLSLFKK